VPLETCRSTLKLQVKEESQCSLDLQDINKFLRSVDLKASKKNWGKFLWKQLLKPFNPTENNLSSILKSTECSGPQSREHHNVVKKNR